MPDPSPPQHPPPVPGPSRTSSLALISFFAGIATWTIMPFFGAIVAVIIGHLAKRDIRAGRTPLTGGGYAIAGLILGYLQIGLIFCLIVMLFQRAARTTYPEYAKPSSVYALHGDTIAGLTRAADRSETLAQFRAAVEQMNLEPAVLLVQVNKRTDRYDDNASFIFPNEEFTMRPLPEEDRELVDVWNPRWGRRGFGYNSSGNTGHGSFFVKDRNIKAVIATLTNNWDYMNSFIIYFEHDEEPATRDPSGSALDDKNKPRPNKKKQKKKN
jgi:hypothetical protein